ncbi:hypothetical protein ATE84_1447 [Aquimarina sp. MAR_2010_214]|uniref:hypothetical protein n=1 Tax=Aquimarina sp. MAR_2010_214 TaxID=1250026 RepID=UPI000C7152E7|nr:hypothetical protein [Aquimarina sp. MAR_2010_214]PKV49423.1 hypothetical protein ATE84_1447 [Aquimarina sp. MAR_2010_214]
MSISFKLIAGKNLGDATAIPKHYALLVNKDVRETTIPKEITLALIKQTRIRYRSSIELSNILKTLRFKKMRE